MSRWIDAEHAEFRLQCRGTYHGVIAFDTVKAVLNNAPSIDIVRCRECIFGEADTEAEMYRCRNVSFPMWNKADDFCSYGEREGE